MPRDLNHVAAALVRVKAKTGMTAPRPYLDAEGGPTPSVLRFAQRNGLSLDALCGLRAAGSLFA